MYFYVLDGEKIEIVHPIPEIVIEEKEMSKFNSVSTGARKTVNKSGHVAYSMNVRDKLTHMVLTTMFGEPKFYGDNSNELVQLAKIVDPVFLANLAVYARREMNMRSVSHVLTAVLANRVDGKPFVRAVCNDVIVRADDMTEIMSCYIGMFGKPIPNALKKGLADKILDFNEYALAKYKGSNKDLKMRDLFRIVHPKAKSAEQNDLFGRVMNDSLETPVTWETELSVNRFGESKKKLWENLIENDHLGYMAMLRNLRNIYSAGVSKKHLDMVHTKLSDREEVLRSKQLPFRFYSAYNLLQREGLLTSARIDVLETALEHSISNLEQIKGKTLLAIDVSGSMQSTISFRSEVRCSQIATLFASMANQLCEEAVVVSFDTRLNTLAMSTRGGIISNAEKIKVNGGGTNLKLPLEYLLQNKDMTFDRMIMFSDNEINSGPYRSRSYASTCQPLADKYRKERNEDFWVHAVDLQGYGTQQFMGSKTNLIAGWSEKVLEFINLSEEGVGTLVDKIAGYRNY